MRRLATLAISLLLAGVSLMAADISGIWVGQVKNRNGDLTDVAFQLTQKGTAITGKLYGDYGSSPIVEGKIVGNAVMFVVVGQEQSGNQINTSRLRFTGSLKDGGIELIRERERSTNAGNGGGVESRNGLPRQTLFLKRLIS